MRKLLLLISICILCASCGVKDKPEYKSQSNYNRAAHLV